MENRYLGHIARLDLTAYEYKVLLLLTEKEYTTTQVAKELGIQRQNISRYLSKLRYMKLIEVNRIDGRNKYYKAITDIKKLDNVMPGQIKI